METIKELNGWTLTKESDNSDYIINHPDGHKVRYSRSYKESVMLVKFDEVVERCWIWVDITYYTVRVYMDEIVTDQRKGQARSNNIDSFMKGKYLTRDGAREAIKEVYPKAIDKFRECRQALIDLHEGLGFESGDTYEGDSYGTFNNHSYISFRMDDFEFSFTNNN